MCLLLLRPLIQYQNRFMIVALQEMVQWLITVTIMATTCHLVLRRVALYSLNIILFSALIQMAYLTLMPTTQHKQKIIPSLIIHTAFQIRKVGMDIVTVAG